MNLFPWRRHRQQAEKALAESREDLRRIRARGSEVSRVAEAARRLRRENHFGPDLAAALEGQ